MVRWCLWKHCSDLPIYSDFFEETFVYIFVSLKFNWNETFWDKSKHCERKEFEYKKVTQEDKRPILETSLGKKRWSLFPVPLLFFSSLSWPFLCCCKDQKRPKENKSQRRRLKVYYYSNKWQKLFSHKVFSLLIPANEGCKTLTLAKGHKECEENCEIIYHVFFFFQRSSSVGNAWFR